jgi:N-acetylmuramoyl-L-alanine amidase
VIDRPSPNHDARPPGLAVDMLVLHYTGMTSGTAALDRLCDPAAKVSAHFLIDEDGRLYRLVAEARRAWHAGASSWAGASDVNGRSIGVELVNPGHEFGYRPFPEPQVAALIELARDLLARHPIPPARVLGHADVAPARRADPGELFPWARLARAGIGLWPEPLAGARPELEVAAVQRRLVRFGYGVAETGVLDAATVHAITAFQRHFRPDRVDGRIDADTAARLQTLVALVDATARRAQLY